MINAKLQSIIDTKSAIGNAIVNKGGTITGETPFFNYAAQIDNISTGTPQTIFQASDGSKWALTNAVNLTNVSNNVTSDFNYWQPANNSTSDPILNIGTVGGNISGNIRLVPVNQVNIAQYVNIVINDTTGAKYVGYNGYDSQTNPTPSGNTTFNRWLLNNSASGTVIFANTTIVSGGTYNGPNTSISTNIFNIAFIGNTVSLNRVVVTTINNGFIYTGSDSFGSPIRKFNESTLAIVSNSANVGSGVFSLTSNNGFLFAGDDRNVAKYHESNLVFNSIVDAGRRIQTIKTNNGFVYVGMEQTGPLRKYHESNLVFVANTSSFGGGIRSIAINNGIIYAAGGGDGQANVVRSYYESNLSLINTTSGFGGLPFSVAVDNGFVYAGGAIAGGFSQGNVKKYHESNLVFDSETVNYGGVVENITTNNGFIYAGGRDNLTIVKYYQSNLAFVNNTASLGGTVKAITTNNGFFYGGSFGNNTLRKFQEQEQTITLDNQTFYTATKIKE
jgi:hypothetical protein